MEDISESAIEAKVVEWAEGWGILVLKLNVHGSTGWPDRLFMAGGFVVFIEFKRLGEELRRNQPERVQQLRDQGFTVGVIDNVNDGIAFLEATLLSSGWRKTHGESGMLWSALQARAREDERRLRSRQHPAVKRLRK